jgi:HlyD family secretion protein
MVSTKTLRSLRFYQILGLVGLLVVFGSIGAWAAMSSIRSAVVASGTVVVEGHSKRIQNRDGGIVAEIRVEDGDYVEAGDLLIRLDETETRAQLAIIESVLDEFEARRARLAAERDGETEVRFPATLLARRDKFEVAELLVGQERFFASRKAVLDGRKDQLDQRIDQLEQEISGITAQATSTGEQGRLIGGELDSLRPLLDDGFVSVTRIRGLEREQARLLGDAGQRAAEIARARARIGETRLEIIQLADDARSATLEELGEADSRIAELRQRRLEAQTKLTRTSLRAPLSGLVHELAVHTIGGVIGAGDTIMQIVPQADELVVEARVRTQDIDEIVEGQGAIVRFTAFNQRNTVQVLAEVIHVSADTTQEMRDAPPTFAVRLRLSADELDKLGDLKLKPGMPAEVFMPLGLPWLGAHFRIDALAAFFLGRRQSREGGAAASLYGLGYGRHETAPQRVLPFFPGLPRRHEPGRPGGRRLHLPAVLGVHVAGLLGAGHGAPPRPTTRAPATSISSWRASARWRCCSPSACWPGAAGATTSRHPRGRPHGWLTALVLGLVLLGAGSKAGLVPLHVWLPLGASGGAEPRLGADERGDDQGRGLRLHPHRLRPARRAGLVVGHGRAASWAASPRCSACSTR